MTMKGVTSRMKGLGILVVLVVLLEIILPPSLHAQEEAYDKALQAYLKKDFKKTVRYLKEYVAVWPDAGAYYLMGYANYKLKNRKEAAECFREAYLIDPNFTPTSIGFGKEGKKR
ncbi:MAG TPA: tetratricopeptide repeat protein [Thermodesulfovibrionales bacterium]|jgi:TolA-binding protein|nr:tetratricopeptide repeat protein [Thermodesulfovibrionales bacterium]